MTIMPGDKQHSGSWDLGGRKSTQPPPTEPTGGDQWDWFTPATLAKRLNVSERLIRKWISQGRLRSYKIDGCRRFDPADVTAFLAQFIDQGGRSNE